MKEIRLLNDEPLNGDDNGRDDGLGFTTYSDIIAMAIKGTPGPFTIGIFGEWGTGKTSLLKLIEQRFILSTDFVPVWFNAWMYEKEDHPILPLISTIIKAINNNTQFRCGVENSVKSLTDSLRAVAYGFSSKSKLKIPGFAEIEASFVAKDMIDRSSAITDDPLLDKAIYYNSFERLSKINIPRNKKIVIFIDDLDRCFPDKAIQLLESIKLVLSQHGFVFVLAVAREVIEGYLKFKYNKEFGIEKFEGIKYLDKIIQLSFPIPPHMQRISEFATVVLKQLSSDDRVIFEPIMHMIGIFCDYNPRGTVRFINNLLIDSAINRELCGAHGYVLISIEYFAITRGLQLRWPDLYFKLSISKELCDELKDVDLDSFNMEEYCKDNDLCSIVNSIKNDPPLCEIFKSDQFNRWLSNYDDRNFAIVFLRTQRFVDEDIYGLEFRVRDLATELDMSCKDLIERIKECKIPIKSHMSFLDENQINTIKNYCSKRKKRIITVPLGTKINISTKNQN